MNLSSESEILKYINENEILGVNDKIRIMINLLEVVKEFVNRNEPDELFSDFDNKEKIFEEIEQFVQELREEDFSSIDDLYASFLPASDFQDISLSCGWAEEYLVISERFDKAIVALAKEFDLTVRV